MFSYDYSLASSGWRCTCLLRWVCLITWSRVVCSCEFLFRLFFISLAEEYWNHLICSSKRNYSQHPLLFFFPFVSLLNVVWSFFMYCENILRFFDLMSLAAGNSVKSRLKILHNCCVTDLNLSSLKKYYFCLRIVFMWLDYNKVCGFQKTCSSKICLLFRLMLLF